MADLAIYARIPPSSLDHSDFYCIRCNEELWACECDALPTYEEVAEKEPLNDRR
jgi:hypothetical protein